MTTTPNATANTSRRLGRPSQAEIAARKANLLRVAASQFVRFGYRSTTMAQIAAAADLTKQTLYSWHGDKAALFLACLTHGAARFPLLHIETSQDVETSLRNYVVALIRELTSEYVLDFALLMLREGHEFSELSAAVDRSSKQFIEEPLARFFRFHGLESEDADEKATLFIALALAPLHNRLLIGRPIPGARKIKKHAATVVKIFLHGCDI